MEIQGLEERKKKVNGKGRNMIGEVEKDQDDEYDGYNDNSERTPRPHPRRADQKTSAVTVANAPQPNDNADYRNYKPEKYYCHNPEITNGFDGHFPDPVHYHGKQCQKAHIYDLEYGRGKGKHVVSLAVPRQLDIGEEVFASP